MDLAILTIVGLFRHGRDKTVLILNVIINFMRKAGIKLSDFFLSYLKFLGHLVDPFFLLKK